MMLRQAFRLFTNINFSKDYYKILGVPSSSSQQELRQAYLSLVKESHPDTPTGNEQKFKQISEAWQVLGKEDSRKQYDIIRTRAKQNPQYQHFRQGFGKKNYYSKQNYQGPFNQSPFGRDSFKDFFSSQQRSQNPFQKSFNSGQGDKKRKSYFIFLHPVTGERIYYERKENLSHEERMDEFQKFVKTIFKKEEKNIFKAFVFYIIIGIVLVVIMSIFVFRFVIRLFRRSRKTQCISYSEYKQRNPQNEDIRFNQNLDEQYNNSKKEHQFKEIQGV